MKRKKILIGVTVVLFSACAQNEFDEKISKITSPQNENRTVIHFNSTKDFFEEYDVLLGKTKEEQKAWAVSKSTNTLLSDSEICNDSTMLLMPKAFQALFNKQLEVEINDSTIQYKNGDLYLTKLNGSILKEPILCGSGKSDAVEEENRQTRQTGEVPFAKKGMGRQHEFSRGTNHKFKYVHEFRSAIAYINGRQSCVIGLIIKLEYYKGHGNWTSAGEPRDITFTNFTGGASPVLPISGIEGIDLVRFSFGEYPVDRTVKNVVGDMEFPISRLTLGIGDYYPTWLVGCQGTISQNVSGEPGTMWHDFR